MPLLRFQRLPAKKRKKLLEVATQQFAEKGLEAASLNEIIAAAGLGKSSYYYYFEDKEDLYSTCMLESLEQLFEQLPPFPIEKLTARSFWDVIETYFQHVVEVSQRFPLQMRLFRELPSTKAKLAGRYRNLVFAWMQPLVEVVRKGQQLGIVRTDLDAERIAHVGMAADNALDEGADTASPDFNLQAHMRLVLDMWKRIGSVAPKGKSVA
jgi:AcrR family transcriptional regulator